MMMQMLHAGGVPIVTDRNRQADEDNPRGYFEDERVKRLDKDASWVAEADGQAVKVISQLLFNLPPDHEYKLLFMEREVKEVLRSQKAMLERRGEKGADVPEEKLAEVFEKHLKKVREWLKGQSNFKALFIPYAEVIDDPLPTAESVAKFLGIPLDIQAMAGVVDPNLYRNREVK